MIIILSHKVWNIQYHGSLHKKTFLKTFTKQHYYKFHRESVFGRSALKTKFDRYLLPVKIEKQSQSLTTRMNGEIVSVNKSLILAPFFKLGFHPSTDSRWKCTIMLTNMERVQAKKTRGAFSIYKMRAWRAHHMQPLF